MLCNQLDESMFNIIVNCIFLCIIGHKINLSLRLNNIDRVEIFTPETKVNT